MKIAFFVAAAVMIAVALAALLLPLIQHGRKSGRSRGVFALALAIAFVLPLSAGALYMLVGTPKALNGVSTDAERSITLPQALEELHTHLAQQPGDVQGWMLLAQTSSMQRDPAAARDAYDHVLKLDANNAEAMVGWAESDSMTRNDHMIEGRALDLLKRAVALHPDTQRGLWLLGISHFQHDQYKEAAATWRVLQPQLEPGSKVAVAVAEQIAVADARAGVAPASASSSTTAAAPHGAALQVQVSLAPALKDKVVAGDTLFVFARAAGNPSEPGPPMPLAVAKLDATHLPTNITLTDAMAMTPALKLSSVSRVFVGARISHSGQPIAQAGDLEGDAGVIAVDSKTPITIHIDKVH